MFLVLINIPTFRFSPFKTFLQFLVPIKFSITTFVPYFKLILAFFLIKLCRYVWNIVKIIPKKKLEFFKFNMNF